MDSLDGAECVNFRSYGLNSIFLFCKLNIDFPFLSAASWFWNLNVHVFRFGHQELYPTFEEFEALLECLLMVDLVRPTPLIGYPKLL
ncbi:hypothetical protein ACSBR2_033811 [Camellia fascicularis]